MPYPWRHVGESFDGEQPNRSWYDMPCYLGEDLRADYDNESISEERRGFMRAEIEMILRRAARGKLTQDDDDHWGEKGHAVRTREHPDIFELRVPEPLKFNGKEWLCRVYYAEPVNTKLLVSLGSQLKHIKSRGEMTPHATQKRLQDSRIYAACDRGWAWHRKRRVT